MACEQYEAQKGGGADMRFEQNPLSNVRHLIGVISGKGGVGKSLVTGILATELARTGAQVGILDADITGPSIPKMFGMAGTRADSIGGNLLLPSISKTGIKVMSANLLLANDTEPVLWRGPVLAGAIQQFWTQTSWGDIDYMLVDMPPGTGDVALTVFQSLPIEGVIIVTSPQDLVQMVVAKAVRMCNKMDVPILGLVENMSYATCPKCGERIEVFGPSHVDETAEGFCLDVLGKLPIAPAIAGMCDSGTLETELPAGMLPDAVAVCAAFADSSAQRS
ncbi:MAG: Mrp/NBP35 family ATP-binding protein [Atopobiaceae bacterium]|jgi:Mrp family chromosome partitioning ATPase|nr:Mrp/NBP35 family ATP-binding protein [Atopobiaceae bacterium]